MLTSSVSLEENKWTERKNKKEKCQVCPGGSSMRPSLSTSAGSDSSRHGVEGPEMCGQRGGGGNEAKERGVSWIRVHQQRLEIIMI